MPAKAACEAGVLFIELLRALLQAAFGMLRVVACGEFVKSPFAVGEGVGKVVRKARVILLQCFADAGKRRAGHFRCGGGRGGAQVGGKIGKGDVGFVADAADDGDAALRDGADEVGMVEAPQVFEAAAAANEQ